MKFLKENNHYLIRIEKGENVISVLTDFCNEENITTATFSGLGAVEKTKLAYYDLKKKEYVSQECPELCELVSMNGNVAIVDDKPFLHAHAVLAFEEKSMFSGHIQEMIAGITVEISLNIFSEKVVREYDEETGLKLLKL
jgi:predicted DNA-binding protein with PD1-like motif